MNRIAKIFSVISDVWIMQCARALFHDVYLFNGVKVIYLKFLETFLVQRLHKRLRIALLLSKSKPILKMPDDAYKIRGIFSINKDFFYNTVSKLFRSSQIMGGC